MTTIDLGSPPVATLPLLDGLPRRVALTLPELQHCAVAAGGAPLPFLLAGPAAGDAPADALADRLGAQRADTDVQAYADAIASLHDPAGTLARRGLLDEEGVDAGVLGAIGLLAAPRIGVDLDVVAGGVRAKAWHRQAGGAVATLATVDGIVFDLAWFPSDAWADELGRVAVIPEDVTLTPSSVPECVDLPYELVDAAGEALRTHRADVLPALVAQHLGAVRDQDGRVLGEGEVLTVVQALHTETQGRLRAMLADIAAEATTVGVVSWLLLADGWHQLRPHRDGDTHRVEVRRVDPGDFPTALAPVLAEVTA
ncbi:hypothetical protein INN71_13515 [Nocardioides sp. ChNu-153]|uniref:hypothetical protein n=1 Tax=unclassified Nocardioides TaxID=2615069 RepID=UPI00240688DC|nr:MULTISPECIES: hypothetical protein [unclassified Nocardioides]MDF9717362.1 hypothetical protein [Nocardioides sp. ChNu-99]MDN7122405.1 hypothetical protein [Nocardioides sp. ChNu-153]